MSKVNRNDFQPETLQIEDNGESVKFSELDDQNEFSLMAINQDDGFGDDITLLNDPNIFYCRYRSYLQFFIL